jgi:hypothetical protein
MVVDNTYLTLLNPRAYQPYTQSLLIQWKSGPSENIPYPLFAEILHNHEVKASTQPQNLVPLYLTPLSLPSRSRAESSLAPPKFSPSHRQAYPFGAFHKKTKFGPIQLRHFPLKLQQPTHSTTKAYIHSSMNLKNLVSISSNLILSQSIAHTKMCREFNLDSYVHFKIQP